MDKIEQLIGLLDRFKLGFYHFTDERNLDSIREHGILSMRELRARGIVPVTGGNQWSLDADAHSGMDAHTDQLGRALASPDDFRKLYWGKISEPGPTAENSVLL